jgi:PPOX class probable F420-dependent enzyme
VTNVTNRVVQLSLPPYALKFHNKSAKKLEMKHMKPHTIVEGLVIAVVGIPESHKDLIDGNYNAALTTVMPDGQPQATPVWCDREGKYVLINTMRGFQKEKNMRTNPKVTLLAYDSTNPLRNIEIRGIVVEMIEAGALEHLNQLTSKYMRKPDAQFFGDSVSAELEAGYTPVKIKIAPTRVRVEG